MSFWTTLEILGWLILAAVIGFVVGWLISRLARDEQLGMESEFLAAKAETADMKVQALEAKLAAAQARGGGPPGQQERLEKLVADRESAANEAYDLRKQLSEREAEVVGLRARLRSVEGRLETAEQIAENALSGRAADSPPQPLVAGSLAGERDALVTATKASEKATLDLAQAQVQTRALRDELEVHVSRLDTLASQLSDRNAVPASALVTDDLGGRLDDLERRLEQSCRAEAVEAKLVQLLEAQAGPPGLAVSPYTAPPVAYTPPPDATPPPSAEEAQAAFASPEPNPAIERARWIAQRTAGETDHVDDLELVQGIGPELEPLLEALGITSFRQIAQLGADDAEVVGEALAVGEDRIAREDWIGQAAALHAMKYGETLGEVDLDKISDVAVRAHVVAIGVRTARGAPIADDDLKRVKGIGPKIEALLKELGITSFAQVARFEDRDVAFIGRALETFPKRITRDEWTRKARALHTEVYGDDPQV